MGLSYSEVNIADIASKTEGYVFRDIESLINRAIHFALMARMQQTTCKYDTHTYKHTILADICQVNLS